MTCPHCACERVLMETPTDIMDTVTSIYWRCQRCNRRSPAHPEFEPCPFGNLGRNLARIDVSSVWRDYVASVKGDDRSDITDILIETLREPDQSPEGVASGTV